MGRMEQLELPVEHEEAHRGVSITEPARTEVMRQMARLLLSLMIPTSDREEADDEQGD